VSQTWKVRQQACHENGWIATSDLTLQRYELILNTVLPFVLSVSFPPSLGSCISEFLFVTPLGSQPTWHTWKMNHQQGQLPQQHISQLSQEPEEIPIVYAEAVPSNPVQVVAVSAEDTNHASFASAPVYDPVVVSTPSAPPQSFHQSWPSYNSTTSYGPATNYGARPSSNVTPAPAALPLSLVNPQDRRMTPYVSNSSPQGQVRQGSRMTPYVWVWQKRDLCYSSGRSRMWMDSLPHGNLD